MESVASSAAVVCCAAVVVCCSALVVRCAAVLCCAAQWPHWLLWCAACCRPDKYQTIQVVAFVQQLLTHGGYYDEHLEFIRVERVQVSARTVQKLLKKLLTLQ